MTDVLTIPADLSRFYLRFPCLVLASVLAGAVVVAAEAWLAWPAGTLGRVLPGCARAVVLAGLALAYLRLVYARRTRLVLDAAGLELRQPLKTWRLRWDEVSDLFVTTPWDLTHKGGVAAGVRLSLVAGGTRHIPDVLRVPRKELARLIRARLAEARPAQARS